MTKKRSVEHFLHVNCIFADKSEIFSKFAWKNLNWFDPDDHPGFKPDCRRCTGLRDDINADVQVTLGGCTYVTVPLLGSSASGRTLRVTAFARILSEAPIPSTLRGTTFGH